MIAFIDPGPEQSGYCITYPDLKVEECGVLPNEEIMGWVKEYQCDQFGIEMPVCYGAPVGASTLHTCRWVGRFEQAYRGTAALVSRPEVVQSLSGIRSAKKKDVWACMVERFGEKGTKASPGVLYGVSSHARDAFEGCVYLHDLRV